VRGVAPVGWRPIAGMSLLAVLVGMLVGLGRSAFGPRVRAARTAPGSRAAPARDGPRRPAGWAAWTGRPGGSPRPLSEDALESSPDAAVDAEQALFTRVHGPLTEASVALRLLGRAEGSFLFDTGRGWLRFGDGRWAAVPADRLPGGVLRLGPSPQRGATRAGAATGLTFDGADEVVR
jgi:hypothetical protein